MAVYYRNYNDELMALADYSDVRKLRFLYRKYNLLESLAETGDSVAASIVIDLKTALFHPGVLSERQRDCIIGHLVNQITYRDLEHDLKIDKSTIHYHVNVGLKRLQTILESGALYAK